MKALTPLQPVDYLIIGHITIDLTPQGMRMGGTSAYAALTAHALGLRVGIVTAWAGEVPLGPLSAIPLISYPTEQSTTFENIYTGHGRIQKIHALAPRLDYYQVPEPWRSAPIVHLAPVAQEVEPSLVRNFPDALIGVTPQGWMRSWTREGLVSFSEWPEARFVLERSGAAVLSIEDIESDETRVEEMAGASRVLAVTEADEGARLFWNGDVRRFRPPQMQEVDPTGAGDIFAAAFFTRLYSTRDPWEAARFATQIAAASVMRPGLEGIPTPTEISESMVEVY
ncbi:MAG: PfkB family carbohydrate kinase [Anaerolineales bacterium]|jgi:sugar/nucleoside kinase (ribokinase family)|nr:PfkB family carbohydrate kinase [Anaerolineales bacterium]